MLAMIPCLWVESAGKHVVVPLPDDEAGVARTFRRLCDVLRKAKSFADVESAYLDEPALDTRTPTRNIWPIVSTGNGFNTRGKSPLLTMESAGCDSVFPMGHLELSGDDHKLARLSLQRAFDVNALKRLVVSVYRNVADEVRWEDGLAQVAFDVVEKARNHGVLDQVIAAAVAERPFVPELRATALHLGKPRGWTQSLEAHGMDIKAGLERLTGAGNPFMDTTRLTRWLIGAERRVCRVRCGADLGTGFLIGPDLVLTCYHVVRGHLSATVPASGVAVLFDYRRDAAGKDPRRGSRGLDPN